MARTACPALLLIAIVLTAQLCGCAASVIGRGDGFSVELIHRDSLKSPFHDPSLTPHARMLAGARISIGRSYTAGDSPGGAVSETISRPFEYLMYVNVGSPPTCMLAMADTGSDLVWLRCANDSITQKTPSVGFHPSSSSTFGRVGCHSAACHALPDSSCDGSSCKYDYSYADDSETIGVLSTETFTFDDAPGGCLGCRERPQLQVANVNFGCTTATLGVFPGDGLVGLGAGSLSLVSQIGADTSLGRRFSYCMAPFSAQNASSALNFGARAAVTEPGVITTPLVLSQTDAFYTVALEAIKIGNASFALPNPSSVILDTGTTLTLLDKALLDRLVEELRRRINLPTVESPDHKLQLCYDVTGVTRKSLFQIVPDMTLQLAGSGGAEVTLKAEYMFAVFQEGAMCLAVAPVTDPQDQPLATIGCIAQQNLHIGYDLDKGTVTFAAADCATSYH